MGNGVIRHIDQNQNLAGTTPYTINEQGSSTTVTFSDTGYLEREFAATTNDLRGDHRPTMNDAGSIVQAQEACLQRSADQDCVDLIRRVDAALERMESRFS